MEFESLTELKTYSNIIDVVNKKIRKLHWSLLLQVLAIIIATYSIVYIEGAIIVNSTIFDDIIMETILIAAVPLAYIGMLKEIYEDMKRKKQKISHQSIIAESSFTKMLIILHNLPHNPGFHITKRNHQPITSFPKGKIYWEIPIRVEPINLHSQRIDRNVRKCSKNCTRFIDDFLSEINTD